MMVMITMIPLLTTLLLFSVQQPTNGFQINTKVDLNRREAIEKVTKVAATIPIALNPLLLAPSSPAVANDDVVAAAATLKNSYSVYKVNPDASEALAPTIEAVDVSGCK